MPLVRRPWGLISIVILVDLALAGTGAVLLAKGLSHGDAKAATGSGSAAPAPAPAPAAAPAPAPAPPPPPPPPAPASGSGSASGSAAPHAEVVPAGSAAAIVVAAKIPAPKHHTATTTTSKGAAPIDPYTPDLGAEVELMASRSQAQFTKCYGEADKASPVHGKIEVAFQVLPNGHVSNAQPVINTTGSGPLASCLTSTMLHWTFAAKPATATDFVRPFTYP